MENMILTNLPVLELSNIIRSIVAEEIEKSKADDNDRLLSISEACKLFEPPVSRVTLAKWAKTGLIEVIRKGSKPYYRKSDVLSKKGQLGRYKKMKMLS